MEHSGLDCLLVADDLTGACDAAVQFAKRGRRTVVQVDPHAELPPAEVLAASTESRDLPPDRLQTVITEAARRLPGRARILFKKIDSTLRGSAGVEIAAAFDAFDCDLAIVTPAFPAMGRVVEGGCLRVNRPDFQPVVLAEYWGRQGLRECVHVVASEVAATIESGRRWISVDAICDEDLDRIAAAGLASGRRVLWAGSAGLAAGLARTLPGRTSVPACFDRAPGLFCIGSDHPVTLEQQRNLSACRPDHEVLRIERGCPEERLRELIGRHRRPLLLSGGDTASLVCRALGVRWIELHDEIAPGIPWGVPMGGVAGGWPVATKSGGFGAPDALIQVADFFTCLQ